MRTLWDFIDPLLTRLVPPSPARPMPPQRPPPAPREPMRGTKRGPIAAANVRAPTKPKRRAPNGTPPDAGAQARYDAVVQLMLDRYHIRVRKWRTGMSGIAWYVTYRDGSTSRLIEAPRPKGPMSAAVFLHEIGHHAIGFNTFKPRCLEEYHAWRWSLETMAEHGLNITDAVRLRMHRSLHYAVQKARRRGIKQIPAELEPFLAKPPARTKRR